MNKIFPYPPDPRINKKIEVREISLKFKGIFATEGIKKGEILFTNWNEGCVLRSREEIQKLPPAYRLVMETYSTELFENKYMGPSEEDPLLLPGHFINHSCDPNAWLISDHDVAARDDIEKGEQITIDYATFVVNFFESSRITNCLCGTALCRREVKEKDWLRMRKMYKGHFLGWIVKKIEQREL